VIGDGAFRMKVFASCVVLVWQWRQSKKRRDSLGAALRNARANEDAGSITSCQLLVGDCSFNMMMAMNFLSAAQPWRRPGSVDQLEGGASHEQASQQDFCSSFSAAPYALSLSLPEFTAVNIFFLFFVEVDNGVLNMEASSSSLL
jgi:hypothetical protein